MPIQNPDDRWMTRAIELAARGRGRVEPNPRVGCVIVRDDQLLGEGWHDAWGAPHAEVAALADAARRLDRAPLEPALAAGAAAYVTLEPCNHTGKTPPCTEALIRAGVRRVVAAIEDPNPLVRGHGFACLREAGIEVVVGPGEAAASRENRSFLHFHRTGRPWGLAKWAMTLDGKIADVKGCSKWITGEEARKHARRLRDESDAVLVGIGTVLADDPGLRRDSSDGRSYRRIVLDTHARIPLTALCVRDARTVETWIAVADPARAEAARALSDAGCRLLTLPADRRGRVDFTAFWAELGRLGVQQVLIEGGGEVHASALQAGIVNEVAAYVAPLMLGGRTARPAIAGEGFAIESTPRLHDIVWEQIGEDLCGRGCVTRLPHSPLDAPHSPLPLNPSSPPPEQTI